MSPERNARETASFCKIQPGCDVVATVVDDFVGGAKEPVADHERVVVAAVVDAQDSAAALHERIADVVEEGGCVELRADAMVADDQVQWSAGRLRGHTHIAIQRDLI